MSAEQLPPGWRKVKFGDVVRDVKNTTKDPATDGLERVVGLDHLDPESLPLRRWDELADLPDGTSFTRTFKAGQVLFGKRRAYQRKVTVPDFDGICSGDILVFEPSSPDLLPEFLPYLVQSDGFFDHALGTSAGSLSPRTKWQELAKYEFALPPLDEQKRIADLIERVDELSDSRARMAKALPALRAAIFNAAVDGGADSAALAWGACRRDVPIARLGDLCTVSRGASPRPKGNPEYFARDRTEHHWIMIGDLSRSRVGKYLVDTEQFLTPAGVGKSRPVGPGSLLLTNCATVGIPVFSGVSGCIHDGFLLFDQFNDSISKEYLFRLFEHLTQWFKSVAQTGTQANLNTSILRELQVPLLPLQEQHDLTASLDQLDLLAVRTREAQDDGRALRSQLLARVLGGCA